MSNLRCLRHVYGITLTILASWILVCHVDSSGSQAFAADNDDILVWSTYPTSRQRHVFESLQKEHWRGERLAFLQTMGSSEDTSQALAGVDRARVRACVYLDVESAQMASPGLNVASCMLVPMKEACSTSTLPLLERGFSLIETNPSPSDVLHAMSRLTPRPPLVGVVSTARAAGDERWSREFRRLAKQSALHGANVLECRISPAGCKNASAVRDCLADALGNMPRQSLLIVLPGQNTLKYSFVFQAWAKEHELALVGIADFPSEATAFHVSYTSDAIARAIVSRLTSHLGRQGIWVSQMPEDPGAFHFDRNLCAALGYVIKD